MKKTMMSQAKQIESLEEARLLQETTALSQSEKIEMLEEKLESVETCTKGCGRRTPVFMAALSEHLIHCSPHQRVIFHSVKVNQGSGYDNKQGIFRAPVAGVYAFSTTLSVTPNNQYHVAIVKGSANNEIGYLYAGKLGTWIMRSTTVFTHLIKDQEVWMVCLSDSSSSWFVWSYRLPIPFFWLPCFCRLKCLCLCGFRGGKTFMF